MKKFATWKIFIFPIILISSTLSAQNVAINTTGASPVNTAVLLDLSNNLTNGTAGFLAPYAALTASNAAAPLVAPPAGLIVYNTATAGLSPNNVVPGYYYWDGAKWIVIGGGTTSTGWQILGNSNIVDGTNSMENGNRLTKTKKFFTMQPILNIYIGYNFIQKHAFYSI